jgi:multidrug efflux pump subunit AcrA (membrane-fusion protein)
VAGPVQTVNVAAGDQVQAGQVLAELDYLATYAQAGQADRSLKELTSAASIAAAAQDIAAARQTLKDAQNKVDSMFFPRASDTLVDNTQAEIDLAKQQLARASDSYRPLSRLPDGDSKKAAALLAMTNAQLNLNRLIAQYNWYTSKPSDIDAAKATADLDAAKAALQEAQWYLSALKGEQISATATGSKLAQLEQARERLAATRLVSPISGTVVSVDGTAGEMAAPGAIFIVISDVAQLQVETSDLSERDVPQVKLGQAVTVQVKALNESVAGHVVMISPVADTLGGDVVYKTTIDLDLPLPEGLRAGMSVDVQFETGP